MLTDGGYQVYKVPLNRLTSAKAQPGSTAKILSCDSPDSAISYDSPGFIAIYVIWGLYAVILILWAAVKW